VALSDTYVPPKFYFVIQQGSHFHSELAPQLDAETREPFDFTSDPAGTWQARMDVVSSDGTKIVSFATSGQPGVITLGSTGVIAFDLDASDSQNLSVTTNFDYQSTTAVYADLVLIDPLDSMTWVLLNGIGQIRKQVTANA